MKLKKYIDFRLLGLIGAILLIISQFFSWFSGYSLFGLYILYLNLEIEYSFLYLFPIISGIICLFGTVLIIYKLDYRINTVVIDFIGLGFFLIFLFELIPREFPYIIGAETGFYLAIAGAILILFDILNILILNEKE